MSRGKLSALAAAAAYLNRYACKDPMFIPIAFLGLFAGLIHMSRIVYVTCGIYLAVRKIDLRERFKNPTDHQISVVLGALGVASCAWALGFGAIAAHFGSSPNQAWAWFFGGVAATPVLVAYTTSKALRRLQRLRA
jgi:hypothetical protein